MQVSKDTWNGNIRCNLQFENDVLDLAKTNRVQASVSHSGQWPRLVPKISVGINISDGENLLVFIPGFIVKAFWEGEVFFF